MGNSFTTTPTTSPTTTTGYYTTQASLEQKWGVENVRLWSNKDNDTLPTNPAAVQYALTLADDQINRFFDHGPFTTPLSPILAVITDWANVLAGYELYAQRGLFEKGDEMGGKLSRQRDAVYANMALYRSNALYLSCARRWPVPTGPVGVSV